MTPLTVLAGDILTFLLGDLMVDIGQLPTRRWRFVKFFFRTIVQLLRKCGSCIGLFHCTSDRTASHRWKPTSNIIIIYTLIQDSLNTCYGGDIYITENWWLWKFESGYETDKQVDNCVTEWPHSLTVLAGDILTFLLGDLMGDMDVSSSSLKIRRFFFRTLVDCWKKMGIVHLLHCKWRTASHRRKPNATKIIYTLTQHFVNFVFFIYITEN